MRRISLVCAVLSMVFSGAYAQVNVQGWNINGQTFVLWEHSSALDTMATYDIYRNSTPITDLLAATWVGRVFANDGINYRLNSYLPGQRWIIPDSTGAALHLSEGEDYFVFTPHAAGSAHYVVVRTGDTLIDAHNSAGPIPEALDEIVPFLQHSDSIVVIYGHWIDGRAEYWACRNDYPVMGNEYANGMGFNFAVWRRQGQIPPGRIPVVCYLHGGYSSLVQRWKMSANCVQDGLFASFDDPLKSYEPTGDSTKIYNTLWFGYQKSLNRFAPDSSAVNDTIINYTARRLWWEVEQIRDNLPIDENRIAIAGPSMGGSGTLFHLQLRPDMFSAGLAYVPILAGLRAMVDPERVKALFGDKRDNLPTNLEGNPGISEVLDEKWRALNLYDEWPFATMVTGRRDDRVDWAANVDIYRTLDSLKYGYFLYWDERTHTEWDSAYFNPSEHLAFNYLTRFRKDQSFPAFSQMDLQLEVTGRQPDPGNGARENGDSWGVWNGYLEWEPESIIDTTDMWSATVWIVRASAYVHDIPEYDSLSVHVTPRKLQHFHPQPGELYTWRRVRTYDGLLLQEGVVQANQDGSVTIPDLMLTKSKSTLTITGPATTIPPHSRVSLTTWTCVQQNYPNPVNPETTIRFFIPVRGEVALRVFNIAGEEVMTLVDEVLDAGEHVILFNAPSLASGIYMYRLQTEHGTITRKMIIVK